LEPAISAGLHFWQNGMKQNYVGTPKNLMQEQYKQSDVSGRRRSLKKIYEYMNPSRNNDLIYYDCKGFMSWTLQANPTSNFSEMFG